MKKRILLAFSAVLILGLTIAVYAFNRTNDATIRATMDCCKKSDSCPMKSKNADVAAAELKHNVSCCDKDDCCCKSGGDSCPMKQKETSQTADMQMKNITVTTSDAESCCTKGADCCKNGGACCKNHKKS